MSERILARPPVAQGITANNLVQAYVYGSRRQQRRINAYGRANKRFFRGLGPNAPKIKNS